MILRLAKDLARALHYLHEEAFQDAMIIHRDIKPDNMGIDTAGNLKLFDFGAWIVAYVTHSSHRC